MADGCLSWYNRAWQSGVTISGGNAYSGSDDENVLDYRLSANYQFTVGSTTTAVQSVLSSAVTERPVFGVAGIRTQSGAPTDATLAVQLYQNTTQRATATLDIDTDGGSFFTIADTSITYDRVRLQITATGTDTWVSIGALWCGPGIPLGGITTGVAIGSNWGFDPVNTSRVRQSRGGQVYGARGQPIRSLRLPLGYAEGASNLARGEATGITVGGIMHHAGSALPVAASVRKTGATSIYGVIQQSSGFARAEGDIFGKSLTIVEAF